MIVIFSTDVDKDTQLRSMDKNTQLRSMDEWALVDHDNTSDSVITAVC